VTVIAKSRVTRSGDFLSIGQLFIFGSFFKYRSRGYFLGYPLPLYLKVTHKFLENMYRLGNILGDFIHKPIWSP
jgi:hypothetical protein